MSNMASEAYMLGQKILPAPLLARAFRALCQEPEPETCMLQLRTETERETQVRETKHRATDREIQRSTSQYFTKSLEHLVVPDSRGMVRKKNKPNPKKQLCT